MIEYIRQDCVAKFPKTLKAYDLSSGFIWRSSPQGDGYWRKIRDYLKVNKTLTPEMILQVREGYIENGWGHFLVGTLFNQEFDESILWE